MIKTGTTISLVIAILVFCIAAPAHAKSTHVISLEIPANQPESFEGKSGLNLAYLPGVAVEPLKPGAIKSTAPKAKKTDKELIKKIRKILKKKRRKRRCLT